MRLAGFCYDLGHWERPDPKDPLALALGGRETAQIRMAQELAKLGWQVDLAIPHSRMDEGPVTVDGVTWRDPREFLRTGCPPDAVLVSCESAAIFEKTRGVLNIMQMQCAHPQPSDPIGKKHDALVDFYFLLSHWQRWSLRNRDPEINPDHCVVFGNAIDLDSFDHSGTVDRTPGQFHWSSSPDRGLWHLIAMWPELKRRHPHITLNVYYGTDVFIESAKWLHELRAERASIIDQGRHLPGVTYHGPTKQSVVHRSMLTSELLVYTADTLWETETYAITMLEAAAARLPMLLSPADCLSEVYTGYAHYAPLPIRYEEWTNAISYLLTHPADRDQYVLAGRRFAESQTWALVAQRWDAFLRQRLAMTHPSLDDILALISATEDRRLPTLV